MQKEPYHQRLRRERINRNWRQSDLAEQLNVAITTVQHWERGRHQPSAYFRVKLKALFGNSMQEVDLEDAPFSSTLAKSEEAETGHVDGESQKEHALWTVPYTRSPYFTGREHLLNRLTQRFAPPGANQPSFPRQAVLTQTQAIKGLGGIGKTQIAIEYAYRSLEQGRYVHTIWIVATSEEAIQKSFVELTALLPEAIAQRETDQRKLVAAALRWLEQCKQPWLLIFDNVDDLSLGQPYLPRRGNGCILFTTRASAVGSLTSSIEVDSMGVIEGTQLLLRRAQRLVHATDDEIDEAANLVVALAQFPLAIDQAGAYIEETGCSVGDYLQLYEQHRRCLLARRGQQAAGYPDSVATTWSLSFQQVEQTNPAAAELLQLCAFLGPDHIPEELLTQGAPHWPVRLQQAVCDPLRFNKLLETLLSFSLIKRLANDHLLSIHRLVQVVQMEHLSSQDQRQWAERLIRAVHIIFPRDPGNDNASWPLCQRYLEQAQACDTLIQHYRLLLPEAAEILNWIGTYLRERGVITSAEQLYQRSIQIWEQLGPPEPVLMTHPLTNLGTLYLLLTKYAEAEPFHLRSVQIWERQEKPDPSSMASALTGLALLYYLQGRYEECEPLYQRALQLWQHYTGLPHVHITWTMYGLALLYSKQGKYAEAEALFLQALCILDRQEGSERPQTAYLLQELGNLSIKQGKYAEAEATLLRALHIREQSQGPEHPDVIPLHNSLAILSYKQEQYEQVESRFLQTLHLTEQLMGPEHPHNAHPLTGLGNFYTQQERYEEAELFFQKALLLREQHLGAKHPSTAEVLHGLANLYTKQKRDTEAESRFQQALHIFEKRAVPDSLEVSDVLHDFADFRYMQGQRSVAIALYQRALAIREQTLGAVHPMARKTRERLHAVVRALKESHETV